MSMKMGSFFNQENNHGIMDHEHGSLDAASNSSSSDVSSAGAVSSDSDHLFEEVNSSSSASSSPSSATPTSASTSLEFKGPLHDMSSLLQQLPFKRGLSKHYDGKSQSFTCLSNVRCLEDLAKPENPYNKKLKSCKSYEAFDENRGSDLRSRGPRSTKSSSSNLHIKKASRGSCSSLCPKRNASFIGNRPPMPPPQGSASRSSFTTQTPLFALGV